MTPRQRLIVWAAVLAWYLAGGYWLASDAPLPWVIQSERPAK